jgi:hypothetical protein
MIAGDMLIIQQDSIPSVTPNPDHPGYYKVHWEDGVRAADGPFIYLSHRISHNKTTIAVVMNRHGRVIMALQGYFTSFNDASACMSIASKS